MKKLLILLLTTISLFCQFKFQQSLPDRYTVFQLDRAPIGATAFKDASQYNHTITPYGGISQNSNQYRFFNSSVFFDGSGGSPSAGTQYLTVDNSLLFDIGTTFTIELWFYLTNTTSNSVIICTTDETATIAGWLIILYPTTAIGFYSTSGSGSWGTSSTASWAGTTGEWVHYAISCNGGTAKMFINGIQIGLDISNVVNYSSTKPLTIGRPWNCSTYSFPGYMQNIKISKGVARYTGNFQKPNKP